MKNRIIRFLLILFLIIFSCKKEKKGVVTSKNESISVRSALISDSVNEVVNLSEINSIISNDTLVFKLNDVSVYFVNKQDDCWKNILIKDFKEEAWIEIKTPDYLCFEKNSISDFSPNQRYLLLHALEKGKLSYKNSVEDVEKYSCMFLDIKAKMVSGKYSGLFCSGEWKNKDQWVIDEEEKHEVKNLFGN